MKQPKYKFGDVFSCEVSTNLRGTCVKAIINHYVVGIQACCDSQGYIHYEYRVSSNLPAPYYIENQFTSDWLTEVNLEKQYTHVPF